MQPMKQFRCPNGLRVWGAPGTGVEINLIFREIFEDRCYERLGITICDGDVVLDIGANIGLFALSLMERFCGLKMLTRHGLQAEATGTGPNALIARLIESSSI